MRSKRAYLPETRAVLTAIGAAIAAARREAGWTAQELAQRVGASVPLIARIEKGAPGTAIGTVFEAAVICGVPLFGVDASDLPRLAQHQASRLALLPQRVHQRTPEIPNDF
ncbi:MAG: helix-turn-helix domain-containing protein [Promicromonosporaceae bacterium]|nr:helix-turn-helix domain-containing protein [Promicromonosporaceae bacterium]